MKGRWAWLAVLLSATTTGAWGASMQSPSYRITSSVLDTTGQFKDSSSYRLLDTVGQSSPVDTSISPSYRLQGGFLLGALGTPALDVLIPQIITALQELLNTQNLPKQSAQKITLSIQFLERALADYAAYQAGDLGALAQALDQTRQAIKKLVVLGVDTAPYQRLLAEAAQLSTVVEINRIASIVGSGNPFVVDAVALSDIGSDYLLQGAYEDAAISFSQAYKSALLALN